LLFDLPIKEKFTEVFVKEAAAQSFTSFICGFFTRLPAGVLQDGIKFFKIKIQKKKISQKSEIFIQKFIF
jgi:hypothetical protein